MAGRGQCTVCPRAARVAGVGAATFELDRRAGVARAAGVERFVEGLGGAQETAVFVPFLVPTNRSNSDYIKKSSKKVSMIKILTRF